MERPFDDSDQLNEMAIAIDRVHSLPWDEQFVEVMKRQAVSIDSHWSQDRLEPICVENNPPFRASILTRDHTDRYITVSHADIRVTQQGDFSELAGKLILNGKTVLLDSDKNAWRAWVDDNPHTDIHPEDIYSLLLALTASYIEEQPQDVEAVLSELPRSDGPTDKLSITIAAMGHLQGRSMHTIRSYFETPGSGGLIVDLSEVESKYDSRTDHQLHLAKYEEDLGLSDGIVSTNSTVNITEYDLSDNHSIAHYLTEQQIDAANLRQQDNPFAYPYSAQEVTYLPGATKAASVRYYGALCKQLLDSYDQLAK